MSESERTPGKRNRSHVPPTAPRASSTRTVLPGRSRDNRHAAPTPARPGADDEHVDPLVDFLFDPSPPSCAVSTAAVAVWAWITSAEGWS